MSILQFGNALCSPWFKDTSGSIIDRCRQNINFTLIFKQGILSISLSTIFLLLVPLRLIYLYKKDVKVVPGTVARLKAITTFGLSILELTLLVLWSLFPSLMTQASISSQTLAFVVALVIVALSDLEHKRSVRPSLMLNVYLLCSIVLDIAQARTLYVLDNESPITIISFAVLGTKAVLLWWEAKDKRRYLKMDYRRLSPEATSGIISQSFLWWLNRLLLEGSRKLLSLEDLYELDPDLASQRLGDEMQKAWDQRSQIVGRFALGWAIFRSLRQPSLYTIFPRICLIGFSYAQPFLITRTLVLLGQPHIDGNRYEGYTLIVVAGLIYLGIAVSTLHYTHNLFRVITAFRGATIALIYNRTLLLPDDARNESAAVTLMSTDVDSIAYCLEQFNECWARLTEVTIGVFLLARQIGWVAITPLVVVVLSSSGTTLVTRSIGNRQRKWANAVQRRVAVTSSMLDEIRTVKMMGLSAKLKGLVQDQRVKEIELMAWFRWSIVWLNIVSNVPWALAPSATFAVYMIQAAVQGSASLDTRQAFTSLAIITLVTNPAARLLSSIPRTAENLGSLDRIQRFLLKPSHLDHRLFPEDHQKSPSVGKQDDLDFHPRNSAIVIKNATIKPSSNTDFSMKGINIKINRSTVAMVIGPVGAGKSTLLRAIIGEIPTTSGSITVMSRCMAYCAQTPWLPNATVQQTVCGPDINTAIDEEWYESVINACALDHDISNFSEGRRTVIGSKGILLSGGQKQRLALARALYSRQDVLVLDDVLSALDNRTEKIIVDRLLGSDGLLRKLKSTVVLVTHATQYLPLADQVLVLSSSGEVLRQGTYDEIKQFDLVGPLSSTIETASDELSAEEESSKAKDLIAELNDEAEDLTRRIGDFEVYRYYFSSIGVPKLLIFVSFIIANVFASSFGDIWLKLWTDAKGNQTALYISIYLSLGILNSISMGGYAWSIAVKIATSTGRKLHYVLLQTVMRAPQSFFASTETGTLLNRFSQDMILIEGPLATSVLITVSNLFHCIAQVALISTGSYYMAATLPIFVIAIYFLQHLYLRTSRQLRFLDLETCSPLYSHFLETLDGLSTIRSFGWETVLSRTNIESLDASQKPRYLLYCIQRWLTLVLDLIVGTMAVVVIALALSLRSSTSPGLLGIAINNILYSPIIFLTSPSHPMSLRPPRDPSTQITSVSQEYFIVDFSDSDGIAFNLSLSSFVTGWTMLETSLGAISRLRTFEAQTPVESKAGETVHPPRDWPSRGLVEFHGVTASHSPSATSLKDVDMTVLPGQKVGICGRTGSGKSSLIATILRLLEIDRGTVMIDGIDLATIPRETIRKRLVTVPQEPLHLRGSIRLNADPFSSNDDERIVDALKKVHVWDVIQERGGLDAELHVQSLSKGQQQLLALARAMLQRSRILLLDEATSSVDSETDQTIQSVIREEFHGYTIITVAHRLDTILDADKIAVMDSGRLVEFGSPQELLDSDSAFRRLHRS